MELDTKDEPQLVEMGETHSACSSDTGHGCNHAALDTPWRRDPSRRSCDTPCYRGCGARCTPFSHLASYRLSREDHLLGFMALLTTVTAT